MINLSLYIYVINIYAFYLIYVDKKRAMEHSSERISEKRIWLVSIIGGAIGTYLGMRGCRHFTRHPGFGYWIPIMAIIYFAVGLIRGVI